MTLRLLSACLCLAASGGQDTASLVDGMIERSNALESFVAVYAVHVRSLDADHEEYEGSIRLVYRAPEDLRVDFDSQGRRLRSVIHDRRMTVSVEGAGRISQHGEAEFEDALEHERDRIARVFHDQFPGLGDVGGSAGPGAFLQFTVKAATEEERPEFSMQAGFGRGESPLLGWLGQLKRSGASLVLEGEAVAWEPAEGFRIFVSRSTGFIEKIVVTYEGETKVGLELKSLDLDADVEDAEFRLEKPDPSAQDMSESISSGIGLTLLKAMQGMIHRKILEAVEADTLEWNGDVRARSSKVLHAYHLELAAIVSAKNVQSVRSSIDRLCTWYQEAKRSIADGDDKRADELEARRLEAETRYQENFEEVVAPYLARAVPELESTEAMGIRDELRALELEAAESACREAVVELLMRYLAEQMERARAGELPPTKN